MSSDLNRALFLDEGDYSEQVRSTPYPSILLAINEGPRAFVVLAFRDEGAASYLGASEAMLWRTADDVRIKTSQGRLLSTSRMLGARLVATSFKEVDPFELGLLNVQTEATFVGQRSWVEGANVYESYTTTHRFEVLGGSVLRLSLGEVATKQIRESITIPSLALTFDNLYWVSLDTGQIVKSQQYVLPGELLITIESAKPYREQCNACY